MPDFEDNIITHRAIDDIKSELTSMGELLAAWNAVQTGGRFLKWLAGLIAAIGVIAVAVKSGVWK